MIHSIQTFFATESGAVTVDFVVLCAAATLLAVASVTVITGQVSTSSEAIGGIVNAKIADAGKISGGS